MTVQINSFAKLIRAVIALWLDGTLLPHEYYFDGVTVKFIPDDRYNTTPVFDEAEEGVTYS